jgi:hypothetical protein
MMLFLSVSANSQLQAVYDKIHCFELCNLKKTEFLIFTTIQNCSLKSLGFALHPLLKAGGLWKGCFHTVSPILSSSRNSLRKALGRYRKVPGWPTQAGPPWDHLVSLLMSQKRSFGRLNTGDQMDLTASSGGLQQACVSFHLNCTNMNIVIGVLRKRVAELL